VGEAIRATSSKLEKTRLLGEYFSGLDDAELAIAAILLQRAALRRS